MVTYVSHPDVFFHETQNSDGADANPDPALRSENQKRLPLNEFLGK